MAEDEEIIEESNDEEIRKTGALLGPEGIVMMGAAVTLDFIGVVLTIIWLLTALGIAALEIPEIVNWLSDGMGFAFFGFWIMLRAPSRQGETNMTDLGERVAEKQKTMKSATKGMKKGMGSGARFGLATLGEIVPLVGAFPFWTWFVYSELKS